MKAITATRPVLIFCLLAFWAISLHNLAVVPPVYEDEPWQASTGWKLAGEGIFGSDMFAGLQGMEHHYYGYLPIHPLLLAVTYRVAGLGLFQSRLETVVMGLLTLALTYALGRRLFDVQVGLLAVVLLLVVRLTGLTRSQVSGILLLDMARIARYDMVVPVFGLASLHAYLSARRRPDLCRYGLAGLLAGLAGLSHLYGAFWLVALAILTLWDRAGRRALAAVAVGFALPWLPYLAYVLSDWPDWVAQTSGYAPRFDLLNPRWYWHNLLQERHRYGPGLGSPGRHYLLRPGFWAALVALPASLVALAWRAARRHDQAARALVVPALAIPVLFALLIHLKLVNYTVTLAPLGAVAAAWGGVALWRRAAGSGWRRALRAALLAAVLAAGAEGLTRVAALEAAAATTTAYADWVARLRAHIPAGSRVLGLHSEWFGLSDLDFRTWAVALGQAGTAEAPGHCSVEEALDALAPDVILINPRIRAYLDRPPPRDPRPAAILAWMQRRGYAPVAVLEDPTYGPVEVFHCQARERPHTTLP